MAGGELTNSQNLDVDLRKVQSIEITIVTAGTIATLSLPDDVFGIKVFPRSSSARFDINNTSISAVATLAYTGGTAQITDVSATLAMGGIAKNDQWETRLLPRTKNRTVSFRSATASQVIDLELFY